MKSEIIKHYDLLIEENNDSVHEPKLLRDYMDKWDGEVFINKMELAKNKSFLEIGVGTGRLTVRVASLCGKFYGVDISYSFDVIYSSLTFMHIEEKQKAINKIVTSDFAKRRRQVRFVNG